MDNLDLLVHALVITMFSIMFSATLTMVGGLNIVSELGGSLDIAVYSVSFYFIGNALTIPLGKPGIVRPIILLLMCLIGFVFFTYCCAYATNFAVFIGLRVLQGSACGQLFLLIPTLLNSINKRIQINMLCFIVAPLLGAAVGGSVSFMYHWQWLYLCIASVLLIVCIYFIFAIPELQKIATHTAGSVNVVDYILYCIGILSTAGALVTGQEFDWLRSPWTTRLLILGSISCVVFIIKTSISKHQLLDLRLFKDINVSCGLMQMLVLFPAYFCSIVILSSWLYANVEYTPNWIALLIIVMVLGVGIQLIAWFKYIGPHLLSIIALLCFTISCAYVSKFNWEIDFPHLLISRIIILPVLPLFIVSILQFIQYKQNDQQLIECMALFNVLRSLACALGVGLYHILWERREVFYHQRLGGNLTDLSEITRQFIVNAHNFYIPPAHILAQLNAFLDNQSAALAAADCFYLFAWLMVIPLTIVFIHYLISYYNRSRLLPTM